MNKQALWNRLLPQSCLCCEVPLTDNESALPYPLCGACRARLRRIEGDCCQRCGMPLISEQRHCFKCRETPSSALACNRSLYLYLGLAQHLIWSYKFSQQKSLARFFAAEIGARLTERARHERIAVVPIPGSPRNVRRRGWDQMRVIARHLSVNYKLPVLELFRHHRHRKSQKTLGIQERAANAAITFSIQTRATIPARLQTIILLDDVYTTGATVNACAELVQRAQAAAHVESLTLSIAL